MSLRSMEWGVREREKERKKEREIFRFSYPTIRPYYKYLMISICLFFKFTTLLPSIILLLFCILFFCFFCFRRNVFCIGKNYIDHVNEVQKASTATVGNYYYYYYYYFCCYCCSYYCSYYCYYYCYYYY